eukprot:TRINITY_DN5806_c0_g1_i1.p1 TRINITY_DN5806_c0_g1~~TRINITY_DN5806_c0_g1_i1.p1  ORF type:complete len:444 (+),score=106.90 TRINITY_DN5806_c0_g1_i1:35-1333(+)
MRPDFLLYTIPVLLAVIVGDILYCYRAKNGFYRFNDTINSMSMGLISRLLGVYVKSLLTLPYYYIYEHFRITSLDFVPETWWQTALLFLAIDLAYYFAHRVAHKVNVLWGGHKVHHSSEDYNFSTAVRQNAFEDLSSFMFFLPVAFFFNFRTFRFYFDINLLWQFWVHTKHMTKGPKWFELIFVTPSHHRVHHASNPVYIDANFGGFLIIWDRIFGTFIEEKDDVEPVYGITDVIDYWNPVYGTVSHFIYVFNRVRRFPKEGIIAKLKVIFYGPGYSPKMNAYYPVRDVSADTFVKYDPYVSPKLKPYIFVQFVASLVGSTAFFFTYPVPQLKLLPFTAIFLFGLASHGKMMEGAERAGQAKKWELSRLVVVAIMGIAFAVQGLLGLWSYAIVAYAALSLLWFYFLIPALYEKSNTPTTTRSTNNKAATKVE